MSKLPLYAQSVALLACLYSLLSAPQPRESVMLLLILASVANAGGIYLWFLYRHRKGNPD